MPRKRKATAEFKMDEFLKLMGKRIRTLRQERGLSQQKLGARAGFDYRYLGFIEQGRVNSTIMTLDKIARALEVHVCDLMPEACQAASGADIIKLNDRELLQAKIIRNLHKLDFKKLRALAQASQTGPKK